MSDDDVSINIEDSGSLESEESKESSCHCMHSEDISDKIEELRLSRQERERDYGNGWTESTLNRFELLLRHCQKYRDLHNEASEYYNKWYRYITYPNIILSTALTILTTYNTSSYNQNIVYYIAATSGLNSLITGFSSFWEYSKRSATHRNTALQYSDLSRQITTELFLPINERNSIKYDFDIFSLLLQNIEGGEPSIPMFLKKKYKCDSRE